MAPAMNAAAPQPFRQNASACHDEACGLWTGQAGFPIW
jgi:hypothetical protein